MQYKPFLRLLRAFTFEANDQWANLLPVLQFALNDAATEPNHHSPYFIVFGVHPASPMSTLFESTPGIPLSDRESVSSSSTSNVDEWIAERAKGYQIVHEFVRNNQQLCADRMKERYDRNRQPLDLLQEIWFWFQPKLILIFVLMSNNKNVGTGHT